MVVRSSQRSVSPPSVSVDKSATSDPVRITHNRMAMRRRLSRPSNLSCTRPPPTETLMSTPSVVAYWNGVTLPVAPVRAQRRPCLAAPCRHSCLPTGPVLPQRGKKPLMKSTVVPLPSLKQPVSTTTSLPILCLPSTLVALLIYKIPAASCGTPAVPLSPLGATATTWSSFPVAEYTGETVAFFDLLSCP